jgi:hypothetical protein
MTIQVTGNVSLGGTETNASINLEITNAATAMVSMNDTYVRSLANKTTALSAISFSDFRGRAIAVNDPPGSITNFIYYADYIVAKYKITDGYGLDTRTQITAPSASSYVGWGKSSSISTYLNWGGDNTAYVPAENYFPLYARSDGRWGSFMNSYAVWPTTGTESASYSVYRTFNAPHSGTYYIRTGVDNSGDMYIDKTYITNLGSYSSPTGPTAVTLAAGPHTLIFNVTNGGDVAGFACTISDYTDTSILWDTRTYANTATTPATQYPYEAVLFSVANYKAANPSATSVSLDFRAQWYFGAGSNPMSLELTGYKGGTMVAGNYGWTNPTATSSLVITSGTRSITTVSQSTASNGQRLATLTYNLTNGAGSIDITT